MPKKHTHRTRLVGVRVSHEHPIQLSVPTNAILTFICEICGALDDHEYQRSRRIERPMKSAR
jgi:hypothetical protein